MVKTPNAPKLSHGGGWRAGCTVGGKAAAEAASVTAGAVRWSAWLGVAVEGDEVLINRMQLASSHRIRRRWNRYVGVIGRMKAACVKEPAEKRNQKYERPNKLLGNRCAAVSEPHAENERNTDPKTKGTNPDSGNWMVRKPHSQIVGRHVRRVRCFR